MTGTVQATVAAYEPATRSGRLVRDDGVPLAFDDGALDPVVRLLRAGQRVRVRLDAQGHVVALTLATLPLPG